MKLNLVVLYSLLVQGVWAQSTSEVSLPETTLNMETKSSNEDDVIYVIGSKEKAFYTPGSAHFIDQKELETFKYQDVSRILDKVPGVYIQEEDGLGLRPNIGLRGAHPHRSKKVTLMEDGILVGPAPYAAPAAYYFPATSRISSMEVFKGPSSVQYGPNSVGGAVNMVTKLLDGPQVTEVEITGGTFNQALLLNRGSSGNFSWLIQANRKEGDLLRSLPNGEEVDFEQNDFLFKLGQRLNSYNQKVEFKFSYANEDSDETYLGLSTADFNSSAFTRYAASQDDNMKWNRFALQAAYSVKPASWLKAKTTIYHHQMKRNWEKFNDLFNRQDFRSALATDVDPENLIGLLRGDRNTANANERIRIGANDRSYYSQGIQTQLDMSLNTGTIGHEVQVGLRVHRDQVERNHSERLANMVDGDLIYDDSSFNFTNRNQDTSEAIALFAQDEIISGNLTTKIGARFENVNHLRDPRDLGATGIQENSEQVFVPGIGFNYSITENFAVLAGVNKGVTLVGPGQSDNIAPEEATNFEAGFRLKAPVYLEAIAFYSDYQNLKGTCSFSSGCTEDQLDTEFNGGEAEVYGLESMASHEFSAGAFRFPLRLGYTFTVARFKTSFANSNPEWGPTSGSDNQIRVNDPMPYIPQNQVNIGTGVAYKAFAFDLNILWKDQLADQAVAENRRIIPSYGIVDTAFSYKYSSKGKAFLRVNNLLDNTYLVGLRPFGLRPGSPRTIVAGFNQTF